MKKLHLLKSLFLLCALVVGSTTVWAADRVTVYSETFGTTGNKTNVSSYSGFSSSLITPSSSGWKISDTTTGTCNISGTSGSCNAYCGSASDFIFNFGNKLSGFSNVKLSFNYQKGSGNGKVNSLKLYLSGDGGSTYGDDILPSNTGTAAWYAVTDITIPAANLSNLCIKFSTATNTNRLDDIKITVDAVMPITSAGWASFSCISEVEIPSGVKAYYAIQKDASTISLKEITTGIIPAGEGVVVAGAEGNYDLTISETAAAKITGNILMPQLTSGTPTGTYYILGVNAGNPVFKLSSGTGTLKAGKAYLTLPVGAQELTIDFDNGDVTGIKSVNGSELKVNGEYYNLNGQRVNANHKGIVVVNGKKFVNK